MLSGHWATLLTYIQIKRVQFDVWPAPGIDYSFRKCKLTRDVNSVYPARLSQLSIRAPEDEDKRLNMASCLSNRQFTAGDTSLGLVLAARYPDGEPWRLLWDGDCA